MRDNGTPVVRSQEANLRGFIRAVIVPALLERLLREQLTDDDQPPAPRVEYGPDP
jgi:hypothetical protein